MKQIFHTLFILLSFSILGCVIKIEDEPIDKNVPSETPIINSDSVAVDFIASFWSAYCSGEVSQLKSYYADSIKVRAGSELLKPTWGIAEKGDRSKGKSFSRSDLLKGYSVLITEIGKDKWKSSLSSIQKDKIEFKVLNKNNILLIVKTGPGNDYIEFEFSHDKNHGEWHVISEYTDL